MIRRATRGCSGKIASWWASVKWNGTSASPQSIHLALTTTLLALFEPPTNFPMDDREEVMAAKLIDRRFHNVPGIYPVICTVQIHEEPKPLLIQV